MNGLQAFGHTPGWAEGSVTMAENIVTLFFGASQPSWMDFGMCHLYAVLVLLHHVIFIVYVMPCCVVLHLKQAWCSPSILI